MCIDRNTPLLAVVFVAYLIVPLSGLATEQDSPDPIKVYAHMIEFDEKTETAIYTGDVSMTHGTLSLKADVVEANMKNDEIETFDAFGKPVYINYRPEDGKEEMHAEAGHVKYYVKGRKLDLFGNVVLQQGGSEVRCPQLHYELDLKRFKATGGEGGDSASRCYISIRRKPRSGTN